MRITELRMDGFGKFRNHTMNLNPGINVIYGGNETGKSTIHAFIRAMLFGLNGRGRGKNDEYSLREPWDQPEIFSGSMTLEKNGELYRIERSFSKNNRGVQIVNMSDGTILSEEEIETELLGMSEQAFCSTVFVPQAGVETGSGLQEELRSYMQNIQQSGDGSIDVSAALGQLQEQYAGLEQRKREETARLDAMIADKQEQLRAEDEMERQAQEAQAAQRNAYRRSNDLDLPLETMRRAEIREEDELDKHALSGYLLMTRILAVIAAVLAAGAGIFSDNLTARIFMFALAALAVLLFLAAGNAAGKQSRAERAAAGRERRRENTLKKQQQMRRARMDSELESLRDQRQALVSYDREMEAVELAALRIRELSEHLYAQAGVRFGKNASVILSRLTEGRYTAVSLDENMQVRVNTPDKLLYLYQVSYGTMNQIYLALRIAAADLICGPGMPLILDEPFSVYDEDRLEAALRWLEQSGRQVILFTSQGREKVMLDRIRKERKRK